MPVSVTMRQAPNATAEAKAWTPADIKRTRKLLRCEGPKLPGRNSAGQAIVGKILAHGEGITVTRPDGSKLRTQVWAPHPNAGRVWLKVYEGDASFAGEMLIADVDRYGRVIAVSHISYTASGERFYARAAAA